jgi:hypothetical protein
MPDWAYSESVHNYRDTSTGRFLAATDRLAIRDDFLERRAGVIRDLADLVSNGDITVQRWEREMRSQIVRVFGAEYAYGRGGRNAMSDDNWQAAGDLAHEQFSYLRGFAEDLTAGKLSAAQIRARAGLYAGSAVQAHEHGRTSSYGIPSLSRYPGDGNQACKANCRCHLKIEETDAEWRIYWVLGGADNCADCSSLAASWSPLVLRRPEERGLPLAALPFWLSNGASAERSPAWNEHSHSTSNGMPRL